MYLFGFAIAPQAKTAILVALLFIFWIEWYITNEMIAPRMHHNYFRRFLRFVIPSRHGFKKLQFIDRFVITTFVLYTLPMVLFELEFGLMLLPLVLVGIWILGVLFANWWNKDSESA